MSFFDTTPLGRILNRFSKDINIIDETLPQSLDAFLSTLFVVLGTIIAVSIALPIFFTVIIPMALFYLMVQVRELHITCRPTLFFEPHVHAMVILRLYCLSGPIRFIYSRSHRMKNPFKNHGGNEVENPLLDQFELVVCHVYSLLIVRVHLSVKQSSTASAVTRNQSNHGSHVRLNMSPSLAL